MQTLKDSELRYRSLFEAAQDGILILDAQTGMIEDVNPFLINMLGYSREEFVERKLWEVGAFRDVEASRTAFETLQANEYIRYEDLPLKTKNGQLIQVEFVSNVYLAGDEKVIQCNIRDITEHRRIIVALQKNAKKYHDLVNQSPDGVFIIAFSGNILMVNQAMCRQLEYSEEEILSLNVWDIFPQQYLDQYKIKLTNMLKGESLDEASEYMIHGKHGRIHYVEVLSFPYYSGKDIIGFQGVARDITARKRGESALQESESRFRKLVEHLPAVVYTNAFGNASTPLYISPQITTLLGYTPEEWLADPRLRLETLHPEDFDRVMMQVFKTDQTDEPFDMEYRMVARDGHLVWVHDQITLVNDLPDRLNFWQGVMIDITARKQAEEDLSQSEVSLRRLIEYLPTVVYTNAIDNTSSTLYISPQIKILLGYTPEEWLADPELWSKTLHPKDRERVLKEVDVANQNRESFDMEYRMIAHDGHVVWVHDQLVPVNDPESSQQLWQGVMRDITERKQSESALLESDERFRQVWEMTSDAMALSDSDGTVLANNPAYLALYGYESEQLIGKSFAAIFPEAYQELAIEQYKLVFASESIPPAFESVIHRADGAERVVETRVTFLSEAGQRTAMLSNIRDVTKRKLAEEEIRQRLSELEVVYQSGLAFSQLVTPKAIAQMMIDLLDRKMDWHYTSVYLFDPESETFELAVFNKPNLKSEEERESAKKLLGTNVTKSDGSFSGWVIQHGVVLRSNDLKNDARYLETLPGMQSGLYVPIKIKDQVIGVINIESEAFEGFSESDERLASTLATQAAIAMENAQLFVNLKRSNIDLALAYDATIEGWSRALDLRDHETEGHSQRVTDITLSLARSMGLSKAELVHIRRGALLHDIGKMGIPDHILLKRGNLTHEEVEIMHQHPRFAYNMLSPITYLKPALDIPYCHHEKWDGSGYPRGLKGEQIPLTARIFAVVDVWDALRSDRPYRKAWPQEKVREYILAYSGKHFDPHVVNMFMQIPEKGVYIV